MTRLFRREAIEAAGGLRAGDVLLTRPPAFRFFSLCAVLTLTCAILILALGTYTRRTTVAGYVMHAAGVSPVHGLEGGVIVAKRFQDGQAVRTGDVLFVVRTQKSAQSEASQASVERQLRIRIEHLTEEQERLAEIFKEKAISLEKQREALRRSVEELTLQINGQAERAELASRALHRYEQLAKSGFVSSETTHLKSLDEIEQRNRFTELRRQRIDKEKDLDALDAGIRTLPLESRSQAIQLERLTSVARQELAEIAAIREHEVIAPADGTLAAVSADIGQVVDPGVALAVVLPPNQQMVVELFAQSKDIGFVEQFSNVVLRVESFPYQKFGLLHGKVAAMSRAPLDTQQMLRYVKLLPSTGVNAGVPLYKITVHLDRVGAQALLPHLQAGMKVEADVFHERRKVYEWVLNPLSSVKVALN